MTSIDVAVRTEMTSREAAILGLAGGRTPVTVAHSLGVTEQSVARLAASFSSASALKQAANVIRTGGDTSHAGDLPTPDPVSEVPADLDALTDHVDQREAAHLAELDEVERQLAYADAAAVLQSVEALTTPTDHAVLTMPLARLVDADGTETVLAVAEIEVRLNVPGVLEALTGRLFSGKEGGHLVVPVRIERHVTEQGREAIAALRALVEDGEH